MDCFLKIHTRHPHFVIGVCDQDLIGKTFRKDKFCFTVTEVFFKDQIVSIEKAVETLKDCPNFNAVGENIIKALLDNNIIHPEGIIRIEGIPIALRFLL